MAQLNKKVTNLQIGVYQGREYIATWNFSATSQASGYEYYWDYQIKGNSNWQRAASGTTAGASYRSTTYAPPENAQKIRVGVKAVSKTYKKNKKDTTYWTSSYVTATKSIGIQKTQLPAPSAPNAEVKNYTATITVEYTEKQCSEVNIFVVDDISKTISAKGTATLYYGKASLNVNLQPNRTYRAYCVALVSSKYSSTYSNSAKSDYSSEFETVPSTPTISSINSKSETSVDIVLSTVTNANDYEVQYVENQEYFADPNAYDAINSKTIEAIKSSTKKLTITGLEMGKTWFFRIRGINDAGSSPWSNIKYVTLGLAPNAPTIWSSTYSGVINEEVILYWTHNSQDSSTMRTSELLLKMTFMDEENGRTMERTETITVNNTDPEDEDQNTFSYRFNPVDHVKNNEGVVSKLEWSARTKGILNSWSPYSITNIIEFFVKPEIILQFARTNRWYWDELDLENGNIYETLGEFSDFYTEDPFVINGFPLYVDVTVLPIYTNCIDAFFGIYAEETYQTLDYMGNTVWFPKGTEVYSRTMNFPNIDNHVYRFVITPKNALIDDGISYRFYARIITSNGMVAEMERYFTVDFEDLDYELNAEISYDEENISTYIQPYCLDEDGNLAEDVLYLSVYRQNYDGEFVEIAKDVYNTNIVTVVDPHPTLRYVCYRLAAISIKGDMHFVDLPGIPIPETAIVLQWDEAWSDFDVNVADEFVEPVQRLSILKLPFNVDTSESNTIDSSLVEYIGRRHPVSYFGTQVGQKLSLSCDIVADDTDTIYQLRRLATWLGNVYVREPTGYGYWATVSVSFSKTHLELKIPVKLEITRVEGGV